MSMDGKASFSCVLRIKLTFASILCVLSDDDDVPTHLQPHNQCPRADAACVTRVCFTLN